MTLQLFGDPTPRQIVPATLQTARQAKGYSLTALAKITGISAPTLSRLENGSRAATDTEAEKLADALNTPIAALCRPLVSERLGLSGFYHRKLSSAPAKQVTAIESQCLIDVVAIRELMGMVDLPCSRSIPAIDIDDVRADPERAANMVRLAWQLPRGPIRDLCYIVEDAGCLLIHSDFAIPEMDALYQRVYGAPPIFWINSRKPLDRVRWSISHELGHLILHDERPINAKDAEDQADQFAAAFLMPRSDFKSECPSRLGIPELIEMKRRWRCSMKAIINRAHEVGKITARQHKNLLITLSKNRWTKQEPYDISGDESPQLLASAVNVCLAELEMTVEELADHLAVPVNQIKAWRQPFTGQRPNPFDQQPKLRLATGY